MMNGAPESVPKRSSLPPNVTEFEDRHGKWHLRFRQKGKPTHYFKSRFGTPEFRAELETCRKGEATHKPAIGASRTKPGSFSALIVTYYGSPEFTGLAPSSQATYRGILDRFRADYGDLPVATITRQNIKDIIGAMADRPSAANNLLDRLKLLMRFALDGDWRKDDPTLRVRGFKTKGEGFHTWTEEEIARFEARHPTGCAPRLAFALMLYTGTRRGDVVKFGWQHIEGDLERIRVRQQKTDAYLSIPIHPKLRLELQQVPRDRLTLIVTKFGLARSVKAFGNWMKDQCRAAGCDDCSSHGLRKAAARRMAEAGCTNQQIKAITGHKTDKEVSVYTAAADQIRLSDQAMAALTRPQGEQKLANLKKG
jgi:integrase